jgi:Arylsulfotransferase (ASST)
MNTHQLARALAIVVSLLSIPVVAEAQVSPGFRLFGPINGTDTHLVDTNGAIVHTWGSAQLPAASVYLLEDGSLLRTIKTPGGPTIGGTGGGVTRLALDGTVQWEFHYDGPMHWAHHDVEPMPNGNVLMIAWQNKTIGDAIQAGRDPALIQGSFMRVDSVIEVQPTGPNTGTIVWQWDLWDHLIQDFDPTQANFGVVAAHPELVDINYPRIAGEFEDWNHMNSVKYDPMFDRIIVSAREQDEIWVIDHSTTTAQAAGHSGGVWGKGGDLLYRYGNPEAYKTGTPADRVFFAQHCARVVPPGYPGAGNFTVFNNDPPGSTSSVWEFTPPMDASGNFILAPGSAYGPSTPVWTYSSPGFDSQVMSSAERLPNGNTLICSALQARVFEVTPAGVVVWSKTLGPGVAIFQAHYVERTLWSSAPVLSAATGGVVAFDAIFGTPHAGHVYALLASMSGTSPGIGIGAVNLPLNYDVLTTYSIDYANAGPLTQSFGVLNGNGRSKPSLTVPPNLGATGTAHFACLIVDPVLLAVVATGNPVALSLVP